MGAAWWLGMPCGGGGGMPAAAPTPGVAVAEAPDAATERVAGELLASNAR